MVEIIELEKIKPGVFKSKKLFAVIGFFDGVHLGAFLPIVIQN